MRPGKRTEVLPSVRHGGTSSRFDRHPEAGVASLVLGRSCSGREMGVGLHGEIVFTVVTSGGHKLRLRASRLFHGQETPGARRSHLVQLGRDYRNRGARTWAEPGRVFLATVLLSPLVAGFLLILISELAGLAGRAVVRR